MNSIFIRVLGGILLTLSVALALCLLLFQGLNHVRFSHYQENLATPLFHWLTRQPPPASEALLATLAPEGVRIHTADFQKLALTSVQRERLRFGQTLANSDHANVMVMRLGRDERVIVGFFPYLYRDMNVLIARLLATQIQALSSAGRAQMLPALAADFRVDARLVNFAALQRLPANARARLEQEGWSVYQPADNARQVTWVRLNSTVYLGTWAPPGFDPFAWPVLLSLTCLIVFSVGLAVYLLLSVLEQRLRKLETVASRIARGQLDARIDESNLDAIGRLGTVFNSMAEHIQRLMHVQREMIHAVSHELRTPVARIRFGVQMIEDCPDPASLEKQLVGIDSDIQELNELIDEILTYARLEQGGPILDFHETNVKDIVHQVVQEQGMLKPEISMSAVFSAEAERWKLSEVEPRYLHRALQNLVGNAMRYANRQVVIRCNFEQETCRLDVEDDGGGIPEHDWERVFTPFARLDDSRTRSSGGYGLGLSIVRRILYWHGGQAFVSRSELGGAKFTLIWPRRQLK